MRQVILDTETTGLEPSRGHRIIEIGCVEIINRRKTDNFFHQYLNPQREIEDGAFDVHGLSNEFLANKPVFADIVQDFIDFIRDSEVIIHNAPFDVAFINAELKKLGPKWGGFDNYCRVTDTLSMARELHPGQKNSLDALCTRYNIDNSQRELHGALLDARILLDVYLVMTGGQTSLSLDVDESSQTGDLESRFRINLDRKPLSVLKPSVEELRAHEQRLLAIDRESAGNCVWRKKLQAN